MPRLAMTMHRLAYRHANGEVEGFVGEANDSSNAKRDALRQVRKKVEIVASFSHNDGATFEDARVINGYTGLSPDEIRQVKADWSVSQRYT